MSLYQWLLALHVVSAFAFVSAYVAFTGALLAGRRSADVGAALAVLRVVRPANVLAWIGATGTVGFGTWLTLLVDGYELWDAWIAGAFVLWLVAEEAIRREELVFRRAHAIAGAGRALAADTGSEVRAVFRSREATLLHLAAGAGMAGVLALMIFKPGAA